jgi:putative tryptophan/tyrosine transport system substrate-binding protein
MATKTIVFLLIGLALASVDLAEAQQQAKIPTIGFLTAGTGSSDRVELFRQELLKLGYVERKNIAFESRNANNKLDRLPVLADELVRLKVDVIITPGSNDTRAAKNATKTIPIVFLGAVSDPVSLGLVDSLARPGGNITGITTIGSVIAGKRLELLKETIPKLTRVALLWNPENEGSAQVFKESQLSAKELGLQLHSMTVSSADKFENGFREAAKTRSGALAMTGGALIANNQKQIINLAAKNKLPAIHTRAADVANGGLMFYGPDEVDQFQRAALMVDKILKGTKPADIPVEQPTKFELVINLKTAKTLELTIPPVVLMRAQKVIK